MEILSFRKGRVLYRGVNSDRDKDVFGYYFSINDLACIYTDNKIYKFKTKKALKLVDFSKIKTFEYLYKNLKGEDLEIFKFATGYGLTELYKEADGMVYCYYKNKPKFKPSLCVVGFFNDSDTEYINLKFMKLVCKLGYDGVRMSGQQEQVQRSKKTLDAVYRIFKQNEESEYNEDYFLCNAKDVLEISESYFIEDAPICKKIIAEDNNADS
jgi:hypothetical protein